MYMSRLVELIVLICSTMYYTEILNNLLYLLEIDTNRNKLVKRVIYVIAWDKILMSVLQKTSKLK